MLSNECKQCCEHFQSCGRASVGPACLQKDKQCPHQTSSTQPKTTPTSPPPTRERNRRIKRNTHDSLTTVSRTAFTLFTKFFFTFRSRYLFTIGRQTEYLVLEGAYLPNIHASFPRCATRRVPACAVARMPTRAYAAVTLSGFAFEQKIRRAGVLQLMDQALQITIRAFPWVEKCDFQHGLFGVQSPLLAESRLISFPPLSKMLQSSGWFLGLEGVKKNNALGDVLAVRRVRSPSALCLRGF